MAAVLSPFSCNVLVCGKTYTAPYAGVPPSPTALPVAMSSSVAVPINPVPYTIYLPKCGAVMVVFSGFLQTGSVLTNLPADVPVFISYVNTAVPSVTMQQSVPVIATLPDVAGVCVPLTVSLALALPAGTYAFNVNLGPLGGTTPLTIGVAGTLNISWNK